MAILIGLAGQEDECCHDYGDTTGPPKVLLYTGRKAEVPSDEMEAAIREHDAEEEDRIRRGADDWEAIIGEAWKGPLAGPGAEGKMRLNLGEPGGRLVVDEVKWGLSIRFAGFMYVWSVGFDKDLGGGGVAFQDCWGLHVEWFIGPLVVRREGTEDEGEGGKFEGRYGEMLDGAAKALDDEPCCLKQSEGFLETVLLALVPDILLRYGGVGEVIVRD